MRDSGISTLVSTHEMVVDLRDTQRVYDLFGTAPLCCSTHNGATPIDEFGTFRSYWTIRRIAT